MNYLSVENVSKSYGDRVLFDGLNFGLSKGDKVALIANNGTGKSSLMKILVGEDVSDGDGRIVIRDGVRMGFLSQDPYFEEGISINELINGASTEIQKVIKEYEQALEAQAEDYNDETHKAFEEASHKMDQFSAWDYDVRMQQVLGKFNIHDLDQKIDSLSGGQRKRLALAMVILDSPELLIMDEPTNHLDVEMIEWLEKYLMQSNITLLMVTHDRYFLDRVCNQILEMTDGKLYTHNGNYQYFLEKRAEREEVYKTEIDKAGKLMRKELDWIRRMPKARTTKSKSRISAFYDTKEKALSGKKEQELKLQVKMSRIGGKVLEMKKVYKSYGDFEILKGFDYTFKKGERIGIVGKNGVGKTTFLNIITGAEEADSGKINTGDTIVYGYYSQQGIQLKEDKRVIEVLKDVAEVITMADGSKLTASQLLQHFMFPPEMQYSPVSKLSGGERRRLYLLMVLIKNPNFLILDEPTNDLDLLTLNKLEEFLMAYPGCLIVVSHDRYFMDKLVDHLFVFEGNAVINDYNLTYSEYRQLLEEKEEQEKLARQAEQKAKVEEEKQQSTEKKKLTYKEQKEYDSLEKEIENLEKEKVELEETLNTSTSDYETLEKATTRYGEVMQLIDAKTERWMELAEFDPF